MTRTVLLIAYHFPPVKGSSGVQRTLRFAQHLPAFGWRPIVLTIDPRAYEGTSKGIGNEVPDGLEVHRAFGLDAARHLSVFGRYPQAFALPDRWATWRYSGVATALRVIRKEGVAALWSTFPIATAHRIGLDVCRRSGVPWVAEFRDPLWQGDYPPNPVVNRTWRALEESVFATASGVVVVTRGAADVYRERFPTFDRGRLALIENGYDEEVFRRAAPGVQPVKGSTEPITLLHSGLIYPSERDPSFLFGALASLKTKGAISARALQILLRASGNENAYRRDLEALDIDDIVRIEPSIDYLDALREMFLVDGLLVLQAANCNAQVPAKLYEYLRAGRPILALTDSEGDTARVLDTVGTGLIAPLDSAPAIEAALMSFLEQIRNGATRRAPLDAVKRYSREVQTGELAQLLDRVASV